MKKQKSLLSTDVTPDPLLYILKQKSNVQFSWYCVYQFSLDDRTKNETKCLSNVGHTKIGNYLILSSYHEELLNLM